MMLACRLVAFVRRTGLAVSLVFLLATAHAVTPEYVEGEVIVTFKNGTTLVRATTVLQQRSASFTRHFGKLSENRHRQTGLVRDTSRSTAQLISDLKGDPEIETVEPNYLRRFSAIPNDTRFAELWALQNTGQTLNGYTGTASADIEFLEARALAGANPGEVVVGVIDTGVDLIHPDLVANLWANTSEIAGNNIDDDGNGYLDDRLGYDFVDNDSDVSDSGYHGTHVAGTIAAVGDNQTGVIGVAEHARILALKVSSNGSTLDSASTIEALQYATALRNSGVNIVAINASYGGGGYSSAESAAIQAAGNAGIIFCAAAGNDGANNDTTLTHPASYRLSNMIVVGATSPSDGLASFSNYGATCVDLAAPGQNILSTQPSTVAFRTDTASYTSTALTYSGITTGLSGQIIDCGIGNTSDFPSTVKGQIALIQRGTLTFSAKVTNAMSAGAIAAIIYNNVAGDFAGTLQTAGAWIPVRAISQADGAAIKAALPRTGSIVVTGNYQFLSGTSMATPVVTGAVAFAAQNYPSETVAQRRARVLAAVDVLPALQGKVATSGRLNLRRVVDANNNGYADWQETTLSVTTNSLPLSINGEAYSQTLAATGGITPYTWTLAAGSLPSGFSLTGAGVLAGTSSTTGDHDFTVRVTDQLGATTTQALRLSTAASGPLDHFTWEYVPGTAYAGTAFAIRLSARDSGQRLITGFSGTVTLGASVAVTPASVSFASGIYLGSVTLAQTTSGTALSATSVSVASASGTIVVYSATSTAGDGVPDAWKSAYGLPLATSAAASDSDGDGASDRDEYLAGTDPLSSASAFKIAVATLADADQFSVSFPAVAGKFYRLQTSADLATWSAYGDTIFAQTSGTESTTVPFTSGERIFIRVQTVP